MRKKGFIATETDKEYESGRYNNRRVARLNELDWHKEAREMKWAKEEVENYKKGHVIEEKKKEDTAPLVFRYRCVKARTDKAVLVAFSRTKKWLPLSQIEFIPGCLVRVPFFAAKHIMRLEKPELWNKDKQK